MPKSFRPWQPEQTTLLPPSPSDWLSDDHQVYFLLDLVDELDLSAILIPAQSKDPRGEKGFDPRMMTLLLLYAYCVGIVSSRKIERACYEDLAFRVLTGNQQPDHSRISEFRRRNLDALSDLFVQILRLCQKAGMVSLGHVALDGTKVQANASKHMAMSHERMLKAEKQLEKEINALMRKAEILDAQEDRRYGKSNRGSDLPDELRRRQDRLARIRQARKEIEAETAAAAARQRHEEAEEARSKAAAAQGSNASAAEQAELNRWRHRPSPSPGSSCRAPCPRRDRSGWCCGTGWAATGWRLHPRSRRSSRNPCRWATGRTGRSGWPGRRARCGPCRTRRWSSRCP